ncbi:MAG: hypothetical protein VW080_06620 [Flavobacteriaceae bacterium]
MINSIDKIIKNTNLNLEGLNVITEAASLEYQLMPLLAARAGAHVIALGKDTRYGAFDQIKKEIESKAIELRVGDKIEVLHLEEFERWSWGDIITNSGMLRPLNSEVISQLKSTAVIPLLWETWEFRPSEIDIESCQKHHIPVIGTDEGFEPINMFFYPGMLAIHILNHLRVDYSSDTIALFGGELPGTLIANHLCSLNQSVLWFADDYRKDLTERIPYTYDQVDSLFKKHDIKIVLLAEHSNPKLLIGSEGLLNPENLKKDQNPTKIGHLCGNVNLNEIKENELFIYPENVASFGYLSVLPNIFGSTPMLKLFSGGLKVGEIASRSRLSGDSVDSAIQKTLTHGVGQDFEGGFYNFK